MATKTIKNVLLVHKLGLRVKEKKTVQFVQALLHKNNILFRSISPVEVHPYIVKDRDLIIIVGGDGTFLKTAHHVTNNIPFLCVIADPQKTEGFFSKTTMQNIEKKLEAIIKNKYKTKKLQRICAKIDGKEIEPCLNEYYIGKKKPYDVAHYTIEVARKKEQQKSSGVLVSAPAGSTAWTRGAGGSLLPLESKKFQYVVREPYTGRLIKATQKKGILQPKSKVKVTPLVDGMIVVADALGREHRIEKGKTVEVTMTNKPITLIW